MKMPEVTRCGVLDMQVCVPSSWSDLRVKRFADRANPCGTEHGWCIRKEGSPLLRGDKERTPCNDIQNRSKFVHIMLDA